MLGPLFWQPTRLGIGSTWLGHVPFGHWLASRHRPVGVVELGTSSGVSLSAFCEAAIRCKINTHALAFATRSSSGVCRDMNVDATEAIADLRSFLDQHYASISTLLHTTSDKALQCVADGSVDLLHINDVRQDEDITRMFFDWLPKLSSRAIVLIHSINLREHNDDVWRFWTGISSKYRHFKFCHGEGLGMLIVGESTHGVARDICDLCDDDAAMVRHRFFILGRQWVSLSELERETCVSAKLRLEATRLHTDLAARDAEIATQTMQCSAHATQSACLTAEISRMQSCAAAAQAELSELSQEIIALEHEREAFLKSTSWRITAPLRRLAGKADARGHQSVIKPVVKTRKDP